MNWPVNTAIMGNPLNWAIVFLMILFALLIGEAIFQLMGHGPCTCGDK